MKDFRAKAQALQDEMVARRRDFHQHPELAFEEIRTAGIVAQVLTDLGMEVQTGIGKTGVIGLLEGSYDGPTVLVRAYMDALPIHELNEIDYRSQVNQKMHACGHDAHTSILLAVAEMLHLERENLKGRVKFVFQPAEEVGMGALAMIDDGALENPKPEISLGLHVWSQLPVGEIIMTPGPLMAGGDKINITLEGKGGHAAQPNSSVDPVIAAAHLVTALQTIVSRNIDPVDAAVLSITRITAGDAWNIIPNTVYLEGTARTFTDTARDTILARLHQIVDGVAAAMNCRASIQTERIASPLVNDAVTVGQLQSGFAQIAPDITCHSDVRIMVSEDMPYFLEKAPGVFFFVGAGAEGKDYPHHHPRFDIDEDALVTGAALLASAVSAYVL